MYKIQGHFFPTLVKLKFFSSLKMPKLQNWTIMENQNFRKIAILLLKKSELINLSIFVHENSMQQNQAKLDRCKREGGV